MNEHTNPTKRLTKVLKKGRAKAFGSGEAFYAAFEQAIARTKEDIDTLYIRKDEAVKQIEELRERLGVALNRALCLELDAGDYPAEIAALKIELDDMERTHMKLPVDADGVPIRPGDEMVYQGTNGDVKEPFTCSCVTERHAYTWDTVSHGVGYLGCNCRHVQPDTVETLLRAFADDVLKRASKSGSVSEVPTWEEISQPYIERIRSITNE